MPPCAGTWPILLALGRAELQAQAAELVREHYDKVKYHGYSEADMEAELDGIPDDNSFGCDSRNIHGL